VCGEDDARGAVMHLLLIAYEYPPVESAQGLRWGYLARELARRGHTLDVVSADLDDAPIPRFARPGIVQWRAFAGPFVGMARRIARRGQAVRAKERPEAAARGTAGERVYRAMRALLDRILVPDVRTEWLPFGLRRAREAVAQRRPHALIASHEPGVDLAIARRLAREFGLPVLADLGDPMLASYAPRWRRRLDAWFERRWLSCVDAICVTTAGTRELLLARLPALRRIPFEVIGQGFDPAGPDASISTSFDPARLELLYTGTLYADFRDPQPLLDALPALPRARLTVIGSLHGMSAARLHAHPQVRYLGRMPHGEVLATQRHADVLVNIGNRDDVQVPGKLFEYFGAARPVLHLAQTTGDPSVALLHSRRRGVGVACRTGDVQGALQRLDGTRTQIDARFDLGDAAVAEFSWPRLALRVERLLQQLLDRPADELAARQKVDAG
jgi:hypothetical protein